MATMAMVAASRRLPASPAQVWSAAVDWESQGRWMLATRAHGGHGPGAVVVARTGLGPVGFTDTMTITAWAPGRLCRVRHTGRLVRGTASFEIAPHRDGALFRWQEDLDLPLGRLGRLAWPLVKPVARVGMAYSLRRFARMVAAPPAQG